MKTNPLPVIRENIFAQELSPEYLADRLEQVKELTGDIIEDIVIDNLIDTYSGDFTKRICYKTGILLEQRDRRYISLAFQTYGEDYAIELLQRENIANCALHWVRTDSVALDKLMIADPIGYCVYGLSYILQGHSPLANIPQSYKYKTSTREQQAEYKLAEFQWVLQKYTLNQMLQSLPIAQIVKLNERIRPYLTMLAVTELPDKFDNYGRLFMVPNPAHDMLLDITEILPAAGIDLEFTESLINETLWAILRHEEELGHITYKQDYDAILKMREKYRGHSNFAGQSRPRGMSTNDSFGAIMKAEMRRAGITDFTIREMEHKEYQAYKGGVVAVEKGHTVVAKTKVAPKLGIAKLKPIVSSNPETISDELLEKLTAPDVAQ